MSDPVTDALGNTFERWEVEQKIYQRGPDRGKVPLPGGARLKNLKLRPNTALRDEIRGWDECEHQRCMALSAQEAETARQAARAEAEAARPKATRVEAARAEARVAVRAVKAAARASVKAVMTAEARVAVKALVARAVATGRHSISHSRGAMSQSFIVMANRRCLRHHRLPPRS